MQLGGLFCILAAAVVKVCADSCKCSPVANAARVLADLQELRKVSEAGTIRSMRDDVDRPAFSSSDIRVRRSIGKKMMAEKLRVIRDGVATTFGLTDYDGKEGMLLMGAHTDVQRNRSLDETLGVVYAMEAARALKEAGCKGHWGVVNFNGLQGPDGFPIGSAKFVHKDAAEDGKDPDGLAADREHSGLQNLDIFRHTDKRIPPVSAFLEAAKDLGSRLEPWGKEVGIVSEVEATAGRPKLELDAALRDHLSFAADRHASGKWMHVVSNASHHAGNIASMSPAAVMLVSSNVSLGDLDASAFEHTALAVGAHVYVEAAAQMVMALSCDFSTEM